MNNTSRLRFFLLFLATVFLALGAGTVRADLIATDQATVSSPAAQPSTATPGASDRDTLKNQLEALGVAPETARARVGALTDEEVLRISGQLEALPAGGNLSTNDWLLILLIVLIVAVLI